MKIWLISKYASSAEVGFESRIYAIARRFVNNGIDVSVLTSDSNHFGIYPIYAKIYNFNNVSGINELRIRTLKYKATASFKRVFSWIDFELKLFFAPFRKLDKPDLIIVSSLSLLSILNGLFLKRKFKCKLIFEIRDIWPLTMIEEGGYSKNNPLVIILAKIEKIGYKYSDLVVGTMPNLAEHVVNVTASSKIKCECIPFGFDLNFYKQNNFKTTFTRENLNIPKNKFLIGYAGSIGITNGLDALIECARKMKNDERFMFIILGDGMRRDHFLNETLGLKNILFLPKVNRQEVASFLNLCDLLYFASLKSKIWEYGWSPNKLIDYMISGKPILASYSGFRSMINEASSGFFVESENSDAIKNKLEYIIELPNEELNAMGMRGKQWIIQNRNWDKIATDYLNLIYTSIFTH